MAMKRALTVGVSAVAVIAAVVVGVAIFLYSSLDSLVKAAVEKYGTDIVQAKVTLDQVKIDAASGRGSLHGFSVANPSGFQSPRAVAFDLVSIEVDVGTLTDDVVVIKEIVIAKPELTYELGPGGNNIDVIRKNVDDYVKAHAGGAGTAKKEDGGPRLVIENLYVVDGNVSVSANLPVMAGRTMTSPLPEIHLKDIGKEKKGATPGEVAEKVIDALGTRVAASMQEIGVGKTLDSLKASLEGVAKGVVPAGGDVVRGVTGATGGTLKDAAEGAGGKVKKLFGN